MSQDMNETNWMQTSLPKDSENAGGGSIIVGTTTNQASFGLVLLAYIVVASAFIIVVSFLRERYCRRYGDDKGAGPRHNGRRDLESDPSSLAEEVQRRLNDDERAEAERLIKENERHVWYESYMKKFTMTAESKDLFFVQDLDDPAIDEEQDKDAQLYLRLPAKDEKGNFRTVDAECAICFSEYEVGDKVMWSELQCHHAYHNDCILAWLVKGKKRCPTCRHWFVPGALIKDQKKELEGVASSSENTDDTQDESQWSDTEHNSSSVEIASGDTTLSQL